jgi:hypothetical protein
MYKRYEAEPDRYLSENAYYASLRSKATLIAGFSASKKPETPLEQLAVLGDYLTNILMGSKTAYITGPTIQIYQLP